MRNLSGIIFLASVFAGVVASTPVVAAQPKVEQRVYATRTGTKYHKDGCRYLRHSKISATLSDMKRYGYSPCSVCRPAVSL